MSANIRITNEHDVLLDLSWETLKPSDSIFAHRSEYRVQGQGSESVVATKASRLLETTVKNWALDSVNDLLPEDLCPRVRPLGKEQFAGLEGVQPGVPCKSFDGWPSKFIDALYTFSQRTKGAHAVDIEQLRAVVAESKAELGGQHQLYTS